MGGYHGHRQVQEYIREHKKTILAIVFIILILYGLLIRLYSLGLESFWVDESISALAARRILEVGVPRFESNYLYSRASLFHYLMAGFLLFGYTEFNARLVSVIFGIASSVLIFFIAREYNKQAAWIALLLSLFLEVFVVYSRQARMYQMEMFFFFLTLYLLYKALWKKTYLWWAALCFLAAYNTHTIALLLLPFFFYALFRHRLSRLVYAISAMFSIYLVYSHLHLLGDFRLPFLTTYMIYLKHYAPFLLVSVVGFFIGCFGSFKPTRGSKRASGKESKKLTNESRRTLTCFLGLAAILILAAASFERMFAFRYVYLAFLPILVLTSVAFSRIKYGWLILTAYLVLISNIFIPFTYTSILRPESRISHFDFTAPEADFRQAYSVIDQIYEGEALIASFTPAAAWYFKSPDYWIHASFTSLNDSTIYNDRDVYTGARVIYNLEQLKAVKGHKLIILDQWSGSKIKGDIRDFIQESCTERVSEEGVVGFRCG